MILPLAHQGHIQNWAGHWYGRTKPELVPWSASGTYVLHESWWYNYNSWRIMPEVLWSAGEADPRHLFGTASQLGEWTSTCPKYDTAVSYVEFSGFCQAYMEWQSGIKVSPAISAFTCLDENDWEAYTGQLSSYQYANDILYCKWLNRDYTVNTVPYASSFDITGGKSGYFQYRPRYRAYPSAEGGITTYRVVQAVQSMGGTPAISSVTLTGSNGWSASGMALNK